MRFRIARALACDSLTPAALFDSGLLCAAAAPPPLARIPAAARQKAESQDFAPRVMVITGGGEAALPLPSRSELFLARCTNRVDDRQAHGGQRACMRSREILIVAGARNRLVYAHAARLLLSVPDSAHGPVHLLYRAVLRNGIETLHIEDDAVIGDPRAGLGLRRDACILQAVGDVCRH